MHNTEEGRDGKDRELTETEQIVGGAVQYLIEATRPLGTKIQNLRVDGIGKDKETGMWRVVLSFSTPDEANPFTLYNNVRTRRIIYIDPETYRGRSMDPMADIEES